MRIRNLLIAIAVLAIAIPGIANAQSGFKVTGGGQGLASSDSSSVRGPGDTYGFNAQDLDGDPNTEAAKGQFNSIQRDAAATVGRGKGEHIKRRVECLVAVSAGQDGAARFGGVIAGSEFEDDPVDPVTNEPYTDRMIWVVDVTDNGEGNSADDDLIQYEEQEEDYDDDGDPDSPCDPARELMPSSENILARGNVQIHN